MARSLDSRTRRGERYRERARRTLVIQGGTKGRAKREREKERGEYQAEKSSQSAGEGWKMSKKRRARARGEEGVEKQKIRVEGIRTRMEIEWFRREQDREREKERKREYVCRASARVRLFRLYRVSSESLFLRRDFNRTISLRFVIFSMKFLNSRKFWPYLEQNRRIEFYK